MIKKKLTETREVYKAGGNIIQFLRKESDQNFNSKEMIEISYDFQSGSYIDKVTNSPKVYAQYHQKIADVINGLDTHVSSLLEVGVGEATTLSGLVRRLDKKPAHIYGFDISWSRIRYGQEYLAKNNINAALFTGDIFHIPILDNAIDVVYTAHSIEPNGGKEREALTNLMRITRKYLVLMEPGYEFASPEGKARMRANGYITNLYNTAVEMGLNIVEHRLFDTEINPLNPTSLIIVKKVELDTDGGEHSIFMCPVSKTPLELIRGSYYTPQGMLVYPVVDRIPCLRKENSIVATHYLDDF